MITESDIDIASSICGLLSTIGFAVTAIFGRRAQNLKEKVEAAMTANGTGPGDKALSAVLATLDEELQGIRHLEGKFVYPSLLVLGISFVLGLVKHAF